MGAEVMHQSDTKSFCFEHACIATGPAAIDLIGQAVAHQLVIQLGLDCQHRGDCLEAIECPGRGNMTKVNNEINSGEYFEQSLGYITAVAGHEVRIGKQGDPASVGPQHIVRRLVVRWLLRGHEMLLSPAAEGTRSSDGVKLDNVSGDILVRTDTHRRGLR
jgi:hypothetical protein